MKQSINKPQLALFSFYSLSLQFATTIQLTNTSSLLTLLGAKGHILANLWLSGPIIGLLTGLIFGQLSDMTTSRYGKRKPYLFIFGILLSIALALLPLSRTLTEVSLLLGLFYIGVNGCMWPFQAWIGDNFLSEHLPIAYAVQAIGSGIGGTLAGILTGSIGNKCPTINISETVNFSFMTLSFFLGAGVLLIAIYLICRYVNTQPTSQNKLQAFTFSALRLQLLTLINSIYQNIIYPPKFLKKIWISQIFLWYAIYSLWVYLPLAIAEHFYGLCPNTLAAIESAEQTALLTKGTSLTGEYYGIAQISGTIFTLLLPFLLKKISEGRLLTIFLFIGGISLSLSMLFHSMFILYLSMVGLGALMGTFLAIPFIALTKQLPAEKRGGGLGVFNLTVTAPQILSGLTVGQLHSHIFKGHADMTILFAGILILLASFFAIYQFFIKKD